MYRVFNCGIGMVLVVAAEHAEAIALTLRAHGEAVYTIGAIVERKDGMAQTVLG
jgi:phosphoribosylformylglycinamidine cyclo-ligase